MIQRIYCPKCRLDGHEKVIAEILEDGTLTIARERSKWSFAEKTLIRGNNYQLICGYCRTVVHTKEEIQYAPAPQTNFTIVSMWKTVFGTVGSIIPR